MSMLQGKSLLSKTVTSLVSSSFVSIIISMCLLANLFAPGLSNVTHIKSVALHPGSHTCKCNPEPHNITTCCCAKENDTCDVTSPFKEDTPGTFSAVIKSLGCTGLPGQFTSFSYHVTMPEDGITAPGLSMLHFLDKHQEVFPVSIQLSPLDKPPPHPA
ncbi:MAG: hypothetical protein MRK01_08735 [Candidatus Scalindua sp.]|nr:hypothetical protein [Candidatus Scalindua sp.]